jgi:hypothetical protein
LETDTLKTQNNQDFTLFYTYSGGHAKLALKKMLAKGLPNKNISSKFGKQKNQRRNQKVVS